MADARDLKSRARNWACRFESGLGYLITTYRGVSSGMGIVKDFSNVVDAIRNTLQSAKCTEVGHLGATIKAGMCSPISWTSRAHDLPAVVDTIDPALISRYA